MTDFLKLGKPDLCKDSITLENLNWTGENNFGSQFFSLQNGFSPVKFTFNERTNFLSMEGSIPYFWQGHNFHFSNAALKEALAFISEILCFDLMKSELLLFEFGTVFPVDMPPEAILEKHSAIPKHTFTPYFLQNGRLSGVQFESKIRNVKLYNLKLSPAFRKVSKEIKSGITGFDQKSNFLRLENRVKKPDIYFTIRSLYLKEFLQDSFQERLKSDLVETYKSIEKRESLKLPDGIERPSLVQILYLILAEGNKNIKPIIEAKMKALGLDKETYKNRQKTIRKDLKGLEFVSDERTDLMPLILESLFENREETEKKCQIQIT
jgi:hypothetical protein